MERGWDLGSFLRVVSYAPGIKHCGYRIIYHREMGSFGNFFCEGPGTGKSHEPAGWKTCATFGRAVWVRFFVPRYARRKDNGAARQRRPTLMRMEKLTVMFSAEPIMLQENKIEVS